jgi:hypothetical protein
MVAAATAGKLRQQSDTVLCIAGIPKARDHAASTQAAAAQAGIRLITQLAGARSSCWWCFRN